MVDGASGLRRSIEKKATKYGRLDLPYVIAVDNLGLHGDEIHIENALFGGEVCASIAVRERPLRIDGPTAPGSGQTVLGIEESRQCSSLVGCNPGPSTRST